MGQAQDAGRGMLVQHAGAGLATVPDQYTHLEKGSARLQSMSGVMLDPLSKMTLL